MEKRSTTYYADFMFIKGLCKTISAFWKDELFIVCFIASATSFIFHDCSFHVSGMREWHGVALNIKTLSLFASPMYYSLHTKRSKGEVLLHKFPGENGTSVNATREEYFENEVPMRIKGSIWFYDVSWVHVWVLHIYHHGTYVAEHQA